MYYAYYFSEQFLKSKEDPIIISNISLILFISLLYTHYTNYINYLCRFVSILELLITSSRKSAQPLPRLLMDWVISSNQNCVLVGWRTSVRPIRMGLQWQRQHPWEKTLWCYLIELFMLLVCMLTDLLCWMCQL